MTRFLLALLLALLCSGQQYRLLRPASAPNPCLDVGACTDFAPHDLASETSHPPLTISASHQAAGWEPFHAFDGTWTGMFTAWDTNPTVPSVDTPTRLQFDSGIGQAHVLAAYQIRVVDTSPSSTEPKDWTVQGSNNGTDWFVLSTVTDQTAWGASEVRTYQCTSFGTAYRYFRISVTANNGDIDEVYIGEAYLYEAVATPPVDFAPHSMVSGNDPSPYVVTYSDSYGGGEGWRAFTTASNDWVAITGGTAWVQLDLGAGNAKTMRSYSIFRGSNNGTRAPKTWTMKGSNNGSDWTTIDTVASETDWANGAYSRTYACDDTSTAYRYFKLDITANNGDASYTEIRELHFWQ